MYRYILFDLDGTLTDSGPGIMNSVAYALSRFGIEATDRAELSRFIGPPLRDSFMRYYGFTWEQSDDAIRYYREYYRPTGIFENSVYDGIPELLRALKEAGCILIVATSKPEEMAIQVLEHFGLLSCFDYVAGAKLDETRTEKADVIAYALELCPIADKSLAVMVGDREYDITGAAQNGLDAIGVLFGYGSRAELLHAGAKHLAQTPEDVLRICTE